MATDDAQQIREEQQMQAAIREIKKRARTRTRRGNALAIMEDTAAERAALNREAVRELRKLLPDAKRQAKQGKPALLRMILRATR